MDKNIENNIKEQKYKNEIFKNLINNVLGPYQKISQRYKFINVFIMIEKINGQLKSKLMSNNSSVKLKNLVKLFPFTYLIFQYEKDELKIYYNEEISKNVENVLKELKIFETKIKDGLCNEKIINEIFQKTSDLLKFKKEYCESSFKKIKWTYNSWNIQDIEDISRINNYIYHFISTRLMWGFSWKIIKQGLFRFSKNINFFQLDFIKYILPLQIKHERKEYQIFVPLNVEHIDKQNIWIKNFNELNKKVGIITSKELEKSIKEKTIRNFANIDDKNIFFHYKTLQLDEYSAAQEVVNRVIPAYLGELSAFSKHIKIKTHEKIIILSEWTNKQFFGAIKYEDIFYKNIFENDFFIIPELKYKSSKDQKINPKKMKNIFSLIYSNAKLRETEQKYLPTYLLLEKLTAFIKSLNFKSNPHKILIKIANFDLNMEYYINNAFQIKKHFLKKTSKKIKNDLDYLQDFIFVNREHDNYFQKWTNQNILPTDNERKRIYESLKYFKDLAAQTRHKIIHEGKTIDFFDYLIIETLDSILTLAFLRIYNKNILNESHINKMYQDFKKSINEKDFENFKKVI